MEVIKLKKDMFFKIQKVMAYGTIVLAVALFIMAIGFMTNLHTLLFDGNNEMYEYYKSVQVLNKRMFSIVVFYMIYALILLPFDIHKLKPGIFGVALVVGGSVYSIIQSFTIFKYVPYFRNLYVSFDYSIIDGYVSSPWIFDVSRLLFVVWDVLALILAVVVIKNFIGSIKEKQEKNALRGAHYES